VSTNDFVSFVSRLFHHQFISCTFAFNTFLYLFSKSSYTRSVPVIRYLFLSLSEKYILPVSSFSIVSRLLIVFVRSNKTCVSLCYSKIFICQKFDDFFMIERENGYI